ncbi:TPA: hypothetical protein DGH83_03005 [Candidatus Peregrinibacteria bacterium]|nr:hypothetical protein [Candidatus Peregrinibacteria bacterium]
MFTKKPIAFFILLSLTFWGWQFSILTNSQIAKAANYTIECSGTSSVPTVVDESLYTSGDDLTFIYTGSGYCSLDNPLIANSVTIETGVWLTHDAQDPDGLTITASSFVLNGVIDVNGKGCAGGTLATNATGFGPDATNTCVAAGNGTGDLDGGGAGHGGEGGDSQTTLQAGGAAFDNSFTPSKFGAGGAMTNEYSESYGGAGGGLVNITTLGGEASFTNNGAIVADGAAGSNTNDAGGGGGAGGTIYIKAGSYSGTGPLTAKGGGGGNTTSLDGGNGGGGRVIVYFYQTSLTNLATTLESKVNVIGASSSNMGEAGTNGTAAFVDWNTDSTNYTDADVYMYDGFRFQAGEENSGNNFLFSSLQVLGNVNNANIVVTTANTIIQATNNMNLSNTTISGTGVNSLGLTADSMAINNVSSEDTLAISSVGDLTLTATSSINSLDRVTISTDTIEFATPSLGFTNSTLTATDTGIAESLEFTDGISINMGSPFGENCTFTGNINATFSNLSIYSGSTITANEKGCGGGSMAISDPGYGPNESNVCTSGGSGTGISNGGAGHGGVGGAGESTGTGGATYDSTTEPVLFGAGGSRNTSGMGSAGGKGGGILHFTVTDTFSLSGTLSANGSAGNVVSTYGGGGGAGGSIYISTTTIGGSGGTITTNGGNGGDSSNSNDGGGGGGGIISINYVNNSSDWLTTTIAENNTAGGGSGSGGNAGATGSLLKNQYSIPTAPIILTPADESTDISINPTLTSSEYSSNGATHLFSNWKITTDPLGLFSVWYKNNDATNLTSIAVNTTNGTFTGVLEGETGLEYNTVYYTFVKHTNVVGSTNWSIASSFTTTNNFSVPVSPIIIAPAGNALDVLINPTIASSNYSSDGAPHLSSNWKITTDLLGLFSVWHKDNDTTNLTSIVINDTNGTFGGVLEGETALGYSTAYYAFVKHTNVVGSTSWSLASNFTTIADNSAPSATALSTAPTQATNGGGYVTFTTTISDEDNDATKLKVQYSDDAGTTWKDPFLVSVTPSSGSVDLDNSNVYQIGTVNAVDTDSTNVLLTIVWDTQSINNNGGEGGIIGNDLSTIQIRITPNDGTIDGTSQTSASFEVDNAAPSGLGNLSLSTESNTIRVTWPAVSTEAHFDHYEIWYGTNSTDVSTRTSPALEYDDSDNSNLTTMTTGTTLLPALSVGTTYAIKLWAIDTYGNSSTTATNSIRTSGSSTETSANSGGGGGSSSGNGSSNANATNSFTTAIDPNSISVSGEDNLNDSEGYSLSGETESSPINTEPLTDIEVISEPASESINFIVEITPSNINLDSTEVLIQTPIEVSNEIPLEVATTNNEPSNEPVIASTRENLTENTSYQEISADKNQDSIPDWYEAKSTSTKQSFDPQADDDGDGLSNQQEYLLGTNFQKLDSDNDGLADFQEFNSGSNPNSYDTDGDGLSDAQEISAGTNINLLDTDMDGYEDSIEIASGSDPLSSSDTPVDSDDDGAPDQWTNQYPNLKEVTYTKPQTIQGLDHPLILTFKMTDSDGDGLTDAEEMRFGSNPTDGDSDKDGISDGEEVIDYQTNPTLATSKENLYQTKISNVKNEVTFADKTPVIKGISTPNTVLNLLIIPQSADTKKQAFLSSLLVSLFGVDEEIITQSVTTDDKGKFLAMPTLQNGDYTVIVRSLDSKGNIQDESLPYNISIDSSTTIDPVLPQQLDEEKIDVKNLKLIRLANNRPYLYGKTSKGYEVVTTWASQQYTASLLADTDSGEFVVSAPNVLEEGNHDLLVYAVDPAQNFYTSAINIDFEVLPQGAIAIPQTSQNFPLIWWLAGGFGGLGVITILYLAFRKNQPPAA